MTTTTPSTVTITGTASGTSRWSASWTTASAFAALLSRDLTVLRRQPIDFVSRTVVQPTLLVFVLGYVAPKIGQGSSGEAGADAVDIATTLVAGMLAVVVLFQGVFAVGIPLIQEFGYTREIEDRVLCPLPVNLVALAKVLAGSLQGVLAAIVVFPLARFVPAASPHLQVHWPVLLTLAPLAAVTCASLGLFLGTALGPRAVTAVLAMLLTPLMYLGCTLYPWSQLSSVGWVQVLSLFNPLTYVSEGFRAAVTPAPHLSLFAVYPALLTFSGLLLWQGLRHFRHRVVS